MTARPPETRWRFSRNEISGKAGAVQLRPLGSTALDGLAVAAGAPEATALRPTGDLIPAKIR